MYISLKYSCRNQGGLWDGTLWDWDPNSSKGRVPIKDVKTSRTTIFSRPSFKTENKSARLEEPLDQYDILGYESEFSRDFLSLLTSPTDDSCVPDMRSKNFFLQILMTPTEHRTNFKSNCEFLATHLA